jgi:hypothetical protein
VAAHACVAQRVTTNMDQQCGGLLLCASRSRSVRAATVRRALFSIRARIADVRGAGSGRRKSILRWRRPLFVAVRWKQCRVWDLSGTANHTFDSDRTRAARLPCTACTRTQLLTCSNPLHGLRNTPTSCNGSWPPPHDRTWVEERMVLNALRMGGGTWSR